MRGGRGQVGSERDGRSGIEGRRKWNGGKSSARSTIFPSRRAVTFYLASFGECSDWSVGKEISFFLHGEGNAVARARTVLLVQLLFAAALEETYLQSVTLQKQSKSSRKSLFSFSQVLRGFPSIQIEQLAIRWDSSSLKVVSNPAF